MKFCVEMWQKISKNKRPFNRHCSKRFSFMRTVCEIKKDSLHEYSNIRK